MFGCTHPEWETIARNYIPGIKITSASGRGSAADHNFYLDLIYGQTTIVQRCTTCHKESAQSVRGDARVTVGTA